MNLIVFEDVGVLQLYPITTGRPAYSIGCGSFRLIDWLTENLLTDNRLSDISGTIVGIIRPHLETIQLHDYPHLQSRPDPQQEWTWLINARLVPSAGNINRLLQFRKQAVDKMREFPDPHCLPVARHGWAVASAVLPTRQLAENSSAQLRELIFDLSDPSKTKTETVETELELFEYPHEVVQQHLATLGENLQQRISQGKYRCHAPGVYLGENVKFGPQVVFDSAAGPIVVDHDASLGPFSLLRGPVYVGPFAKLSEYALIKDHVSIGHHCKIGGEVEASLIEPYSNKQHHGFLGHSYLGSWINLGAGTCNSDLKNTYGLVNVEYEDRKLSTDMQFFGCVIGDYAKTAINTSIFTGKIIGTASMVYGFATTNVPSFVNYARTFGELGNLPPDVIVSTQARMFARRNVQQRPCDIQLVHDMYRLTAGERPAGLSDQPLTL